LPGSDALGSHVLRTGVRGNDAFGEIPHLGSPLELRRRRWQEGSCWALAERPLRGDEVKSFQKSSSVFRI